MTGWQIFILGVVAGFVLLSMTVETKRRGVSVTQPPMIGAVFVCFDYDHGYMWIGVGDHFETFTKGDPRSYPRIYIRIVKRRADCGDFRDQDLGFEHFAVSDGWVQMLAPNLYLVFR